MVISSAGTVMAIRAAVAAYRNQEAKKIKGDTGNPWFSINVPATCDKIRMAAEDPELQKFVAATGSQELKMAFEIGSK